METRPDFSEVDHERSSLAMLCKGSIEFLMSLRAIPLGYIDFKVALVSSISLLFSMSSQVGQRQGVIRAIHFPLHCAQVIPSFSKAVALIHMY